MSFSALCFDLDGTLVETERLKARSYADAAAELRPDVRAADVEAAYVDLVGQSREHVIAALVRRFDLAGAARARMADLGAATPEEAFGALRLRRYEAMLLDRDLVKGQEYPADLGSVGSLMCSNRWTTPVNLRTGYAAVRVAPIGKAGHSK